jgi:K+-transporting ATPase A subunit
MWKRTVDINSLKEALTKETNMLYTILTILVILWLLGLVGGVGGNLIHLLLVVALVVFIFQLLSGRRVAWDVWHREGAC